MKFLSKHGWEILGNAEDENFVTKLRIRKGKFIMLISPELVMDLNTYGVDGEEEVLAILDGEYNNYLKTKKEDKFVKFYDTNFSE